MRILFFALLATAAAQNQTGSVKGVVVDSLSHQPVRKASVSVNQFVNPRNGQVAGHGPGSVVTDASGAFSFDNVPAGQVQIMVQHANYPPASATMKSIEVKPGETAGPITMELIPGAVLTGRVLDEDGDPLSGCMVNPHPNGRSDQGVAGQGRNNSDINGEYRIFDLPPGKYTVSIDCQRPAYEARPFSAGPEAPPSRAYPAEYYPATEDAKSAELIELAPGAEKSGVDFQMKPVPVTQVRGRFSGDNWRGRQNLMLQLAKADADGPNRFSFGSNFDLAKGTFEFPKVFPGSYLLIGFSNENPENRIGSVTRIEVKDQPVETVIEWRQAIDLSGTVELENHGNQNVALNQISIQLVPDYWIGMPGSQAMAQDDGTFVIKSVLPAAWRIRVQGSGVFLKSAWMGTEEIGAKALDLTGGAAGVLKIVASNNTGTIKGTAPAGEMVYAARMEAMPMFGSSFQGASADANGNFSIGSVIPGKYRLAAQPIGGFAGSMPGGGPGMSGDAGTEVTVAEGETVTVDIKKQN